MHLETRGRKKQAAIVSSGTDISLTPTKLHPPPAQALPNGTKVDQQSTSSKIAGAGHCSDHTVPDEPEWDTPKTGRKNGEFGAANRSFEGDLKVVYIRQTEIHRRFRVALCNSDSDR